MANDAVTLWSNCRHMTVCEAPDCHNFTHLTWRMTDTGQTIMLCIDCADDRNRAARPLNSIVEMACQISPVWSIDWSDGSGVGRYGDLVILFDSHSNVMVYNVPDRSNDDAMRADFDQQPAESWAIWEGGHECLIDEPDTGDESEHAGAYAYVRSVLVTLGARDGSER